jgi:molybdate transport system substrate-binding protein
MTKERSYPMTSLAFKQLVRRLRGALVICLALGLAVPATASALNVYAASSLRDVFTQITASPTYNFAGSNQLQLQIERGAPADVFASASPQEARALFKQGGCTRPVTFATNKLVLIVPNSNPGRVKSIFSLRSGGRTLAIGSASVPVGSYTRALLRRLGLSKILQTNTVSQEANVASIVSKVALGSADAGLAYASDARIARDRVKLIRLPRYAQPPVRYQICQVIRAGADAAGAKAFIASVRSGRGRSLLKAGGFGLPPKG